MQSQLSHSLRSFARHWFALGLVLGFGFIALLSAVLTLSLKAFDDIDSPSHVTVPEISIAVAVGCSDAGATVLAAEGVGCAGERFGMSQAWARSERSEGHGYRCCIVGGRCRW